VNSSARLHLTGDRVFLMPSAGDGQPHPQRHTAIEPWAPMAPPATTYTGNDHGAGEGSRKVGRGTLSPSSTAAPLRYSGTTTVSAGQNPSPSVDGTTGPPALFGAFVTRRDGFEPQAQPGAATSRSTGPLTGAAVSTSSQAPTIHRPRRFTDHQRVPRRESHRARRQRGMWSRPTDTSRSSIPGASSRLSGAGAFDF
jgi:hypothetical protein